MAVLGRQVAGHRDTRAAHGSERDDTHELSSCGSLAATLSGLAALVPTSRDHLLRTIESEVIPRLVLAHRGARPAPAVARPDAAVESAQVEELARRLIDGDTEPARDYVSKMLADGVPLDALYLDLLAPAARRLGEMWTEDACDFTAVTVGLWRLQRLLHDYAPQFESDGEADLPMDGRRILLAPMPGEQHTFGLFMVAEFFRRSGWDVVDGPVSHGAELVSAVSRQPFDVVGLSLSCSNRLDDLAALVRDLRRTSRNPAIGIIVGGPVFIDQPDAVLRVDADVSATDAKHALLAAQELLFSASQRECAVNGR